MKEREINKFSLQFVVFVDVFVVVVVVFAFIDKIAIVKKSMQKENIKIYKDLNVSVVTLLRYKFKLSSNKPLEGLRE